VTVTCVTKCTHSRVVGLRLEGNLVYILFRWVGMNTQNIPLVTALVAVCAVCGSSGMVPTFDVPIVNVTVVRGQIALLPCSIDFLGKYKVGDSNAFACFFP